MDHRRVARNYVVTTPVARLRQSQQRLGLARLFQWCARPRPDPRPAMIRQFDAERRNSGWQFRWWGVLSKTWTRAPKACIPPFWSPTGYGRDIPIDAGKCSL